MDSSQNLSQTSPQPSPHSYDDINLDDIEFVLEEEDERAPNQDSPQPSPPSPHQNQNPSSNEVSSYATILSLSYVDSIGNVPYTH